MLDVCHVCSVPTWCVKRADGRPQCHACQVELFFDRVLFAPLGFTLLAWQRKVLRSIYGDVDLVNGFRKIERAYIEVAKKNGKSFLVGGLPLFHLLMETEQSPKAYGAAAAKDQAGLVFDAASQLVTRNPVLKRKLEVIPSSKIIRRWDGGGEYKVISADGDLQDGVGPSLAIFDELHRWHTDKAKTLWDVLTKGTIAREQPLVVEITTAGTQHSSPICYQEHEYARRVLSGQIKSERFFGFITSADPVKIKEDPHYWRSREARVAANPSHEDNGGFLKDARLASIMEEAIEKPHERNAYFRYHLNIWTSAQNRYLPMDSWHNCGAPTRALSGRRCIAGLDLSHTTDLTALTLLFPDRDDTFDVYPLFFMPSGRVAERERQDKQPYSAWAQMGYLTLTEGETIKYSEIVEKIQWAYKEFRLEMLIADPKDMASIQQRCDELGIPHMEQPQGYHLSPAMKELLSLILQGRIRHGNNPILTWNADCLSAKTNDNGDVKPIKPNRSSENVRIDGVIALLDALNYTLRIPQSPSTLATFV